VHNRAGSWQGEKIFNKKSKILLTKNIGDAEAQGAQREEFLPYEHNERKATKAPET